MIVDLFGWNAPVIVVIWLIVGTLFVPAASWMLHRSDRSMSWWQAYKRALLLPLLAVALPVVMYLIYLAVVTAISFGLALIVSIVVMSALFGGGGSMVVIFVIFER